VSFALVLTAGCTATESSSSSSATGSHPGTSAGGIRGAIFTTTADGARVDANLYASKEAVYLDGGPGADAPSSAAALPAGDYFFQVTDPSGHHLLSSDHVSCRKIHVDAAGFIDQAYAGTSYVRAGTTWSPISCGHTIGTDQDHGGEGAITVQLVPFDDTPNHGGEYKVWVTPVDRYTHDAAFIPGPGDHQVNGEGWSAGNAHGFAPAASKTDNFKVRSTQPDDDATCGDGELDEHEACDDGNIVSGDGCDATCHLEDHECGCGNGQLEAGEECDDGNTVSGDGCDATCHLEDTCTCP
jgi:cysteine-rich repeat protein